MRGNCLFALSRYVNGVKECCERYQGMLRDKVSMGNVVTRVERVRVKFIVVECRSLCCSVVKVVNNEYVKRDIIFDFE